LAFCSFPPAFWRRQLYSGASRLRQPNGDCLLRRARAVLAFPDVFHFFANKLARLRTRRHALTLVLACAFDCFFFWHNKNVSPPARALDVKDLRRI
jgi:hypothetical protein